jgi:hypothetical protein
MALSRDENGAGIHGFGYLYLAHARESIESSI